MKPAMRHFALILLFAGSCAAEQNRHPRPSGYADADQPRTKPGITFMPGFEDVGVYMDIMVSFSRGEAPQFKVTRVEVNSAEKKEYLVSNDSAVNQHRTIYGSEDFAIMTYADWEPGQSYTVLVSGVDDDGKEVKLKAQADAPKERPAAKGVGFLGPSASIPCHHISLMLAKEAIEPGKVTRVEVDGQLARDVRVFNIGPQYPKKAGKGPGLSGESYEKIVDGSRDLRVVAPCDWTAGSKHSIRVVITDDSGKETVHEQQNKAEGGAEYWDAAWPHFVSIALRETAGLIRQGEPVHLSFGVFSDDITDPQKEIRVVTYWPTHPKADAKGYVVAPCQITSTTTWRDEAMLSKEEKDAETGEIVHRYDPTTTVDLVFLADVMPYEERVYQVLYGNAKAEPLVPQTDLKVTQKNDLAQDVENAHYRYQLASNSGAIETVTVLGDGEPVLLEHKLETNGAVHWNPDAYVPPKPWVHVSDWEKPEFRQITGPIMHRTRRYGPMPFLDEVTAHVAYTFYANEPYLISSSLTEIKKDLFVQAMRNAEIVFNHAVLDEFVWLDPSGTVKSLNIETSHKHPSHALVIPPDTPWWALVSRQKKVGFAAISLAYENTNIFGDPNSEAQPFIYVQNGPWIYVSRGLVYPFGGNNLTRLMPVRRGSIYFEKWAYLPFRLTDENAPFENVERIRKQLKHPLLVHEWQRTDPRTPLKWVSPILTAPFDEGVTGAVSSQKDIEKKKEEKK